MLLELFSWVLNLPPLLYLAVGLITALYLMNRSPTPTNLPPQPASAYPILGHMPYLKGDPTTIFRKWRKETGEMFSLYLGPQLVVVLNNWDLMKEALVKKADYFSDRPDDIITRTNFKTNGCLGIIGNSGPDWKEQRVVSMNILRSFGMGKNWLAEKITEEVDTYLESLGKFKGQPAGIQFLTNASVSNVICAILVGQRFDLDEPLFKTTLRLVNENLSILSGTTILNVFPWLEYLPGDMFGAKKIISNIWDINQHFSFKFLKEAKHNEEGQGVENFITSYLKQLKAKEQSGNETHLSEGNLMRIVSNLFVAGSETTSTTILWAVLMAIRNPKAQEKCYQEILDVSGPEKRPTIQDKAKMNYFSAYIMESQRIGSILPLSLNHKCNETVEVAGYTIPKGTTIIQNLDEVLKDQKTWGDPEVFRPERFLDKDGKVFVPEQFIPFSIGRRYCMGESLARMELFLFLTAIFQRFHIEAEDPDNLPPARRVFAITSAPEVFNVRLIDRFAEH